MKKISILIALAAFAAAGCIKDESTDGTPLAPIKIQAMDGYTFVIGEPSTFTPEIEWNGEKESDYTFSWRLNGLDEISTEKVLNYTFPEAGIQYLNLTITNKGNGITYNQDYEISVNSPFALGWAILSKGAGNVSQLSFVHMESFKLYPDIYASMHPDKPLGKGPVAIASHSVAKADEICVMQDEGGWVELDGSNFAIVSSVEKEFIDGRYPDEDGGFAPASVHFTQRGAEFVISRSGKVYDRVTANPTTASTLMNTYYYASVPWFYKGYAEPTKFTYSTLWPGQYCIPLFDDANKRWVPFGVTYSSPRNIQGMVWGGTKPSADFDYIAGMASDVNIVYAETTGDTGTKFTLFSIFEKDGKLYADKALWTSPTSAGNVSLSGYEQKELPEGYELSASTPFWLMRTYSTGEYSTDPFLLFGQGSKLYFYHFPTGAVSLVRDFSKGKTACGGNVVSFQQNGNAKQVGVLTSDGHFYVLSFSKNDAMGLIQNNIDPEDPDNNKLELAHVSGIPGDPVQVIFKYGKAANWQQSKIDY